MNGYSDPINHALAFATKHHDQLVRKGTRAPYLTAAPNVAVILTRYGQDDETIVAGILYDAVEDCVRDGYTQDMLDQRIGDKFGAEALETVLSAVERRYDDDGVELAADERKEDLLVRLGNASPRARWVLAGNLVHGAGTLLADLARTDFPENVWSRRAGGREGTVRWYRRFLDRLVETEFREPIIDELARMVDLLEQHAAAAPPRRPTRSRA
ncbi:MAG TPA: HD domain-containing protein [Gemmatimonadaceae bacterium]|nr:HD domain-containing protein [Gemmatimonadaceae bacterium]